MTTNPKPWTFDTKAILKLYSQGKYTDICQEIITALKHFESTLYITLADDVQTKIDDFVSTVFFLILQEDFTIPNNYSIALISMNHLLANVIAMSSYNTADSVIQHLLRHQKNFIKLLMLYTCYTKDILNHKQLFDSHPLLASHWWQNYQTAPAGSLTEQMHHNMTNQLKWAPDKFALKIAQTAPLYFQCTYYTEGADEKPIKEMFNRELRKLTKNQRPIKNYPDKKNIAIISGRWQPTTAVYKSLFPMINELSKTHDLTLIHFGEHEDQIEKSAFKHIKKVTFNKDMTTMDLRAIELNGYQMAYFADVGMNSESTYLSNIQLAPIMAIGYGHPVSTFGSKIDYFIGGQDVEDASKAKENYSERLVLIPGIGAAPVDPKYTRKNLSKEKFTINCCWTASKINYPMIMLLRDVVCEANRPVHITFYPSWTVGRYNNAVPLQKLLQNVIPNVTTIHLDKKYHEYLELLEKGSITLDSHPFGGYNTVVDSMFVGIPVVTIEGGQFYNRSAAALLRRVGLDNCITHSIEECKAALLQLINNPPALEARCKKLESVDLLKKQLLQAPEPPGFVRAIDYLIENHEQLKAENSNEPIIIN